MEAFIALTDRAWFDFLSSRTGPDHRLDEVNFWSPSSKSPLKNLPAGTPFFFRLKSPLNVVAGYGFYAHFTILGLDQAWEWFGIKNGDPDEVRFLRRIGDYRKVDLLDPSSPRERLGCTVLRDARFWPRERWIPWTQGWSPQIVRGKTEKDPIRVSRLLGEIQYDHQTTPEELTEAFTPLDVDERTLRVARTKPREGQGTFRTRLLDAYGRRCAVTGEHTEIVLEAAHIQPYLGPRSNHVQNGILLTREFHTLFDQGYVTVTPDYEIRVSPRLRTEWDNGRRYYPFDGERLQHVPNSVAERPSAEVLEWHGKHRFR